jgi:hypothetical protein
VLEPARRVGHFGGAGDTHRELHRTGVAAMDMQSLLFAFAIGWGVWMLLKIHRQRGGGRGALVGKRDSGRAASRPARRDVLRSMPRVGEPGSMTANQARALRRNNFEPDKRWSFEEAALILDAMVYMRAVCRDVAGRDDGPPPLEVQNALLRFILTDQDLRDYVRKWGELRRDDGAEDDDDPELMPNNQYERIAEAARNHIAT